MQFGSLTTFQQMEKYYKKMRAVSRTQLLSSIYKNQGQVSEQKIEKDLTEVFVTLTSNYNFDSKSPIVVAILHMFDINPDELQNKNAEQREVLIKRKILNSIEEKLVKLPNQAETVQYELGKMQQDSNLFDWVGVKSKFQNLRSIFQEILLEKVKQFDEELSRLTEMHHIKEETKDQLFTTARTRTFRTTKTLSNEPRLKEKSALSVKKLQRDLEKKGFTNVLIRDHSEFALSKWSRQQEKQFQNKKKQFRLNFRKNGYQTPIIFQFVKKYTKTVKARDNIFQKWENREKNGISSEQLKFLCATSLFLNQTMYKSEKDRLNRNIKSLGKQLISNLEFNIAEKIIETYKQFMKKVADLRAHYYEQLTEKRKYEFFELKKKGEEDDKSKVRKNQFLKYKQIFINICNSQKMKIYLNPKIFRWVKWFVEILKSKYEEKTGKKLFQLKHKQVFSRLFTNNSKSALLLKSKLKYPSSRVIKRQDIGSMRQPMKKYIPTERFFYEKSFETKIKTLNSIRIKSQTSFMKQISGGPKEKMPDLVYVNLAKKQIVLSSSNCLRLIIKIQAKWKAIRQRRIYLDKLEDYLLDMEKDFFERLKSLKWIYPRGTKLNIKLIQDRLKRVSMRTLNIFKPYVRNIKKPINNYTSFSQISFSLSQLKNKQSKNSKRRLAQFGKMVQNDDYARLIRSGFVVTAKEINESIFKEGANAMWWAVKNCNVDLTKVFLEGGGNPNSKNFEGSTCLHQAMQNGDLQIIFLLLDYGADLNIKNSKKHTPLYFATPRMLKLLGLEEGVVSSEDSLKDNNSMYFKPQTSQNFYLEHYY